MRDCDERERWAACEGWDKDKKKKEQNRTGRGQMN
jgi:hypothetical protein